jgi:hypothetical protein
MISVHVMCPQARQISQSIALPGKWAWMTSRDWHRSQCAGGGGAMDMTTQSIDRALQVRKLAPIPQDRSEGDLCAATPNYSSR